jgi:p-hydroxybenzoate 3-monooxygenase
MSDSGEFLVIPSFYFSSPRGEASRVRTQVAIVGAGPAGLLLGRMLDRAGIENVIVERRDRAYCESRVRAGVLEQGTVDLLAELGVDARMRRRGLVHGGIELRWGHDGEREGHRIPMADLTGGRHVTIYGQTEVVKDLIAARLDEGGPLLFEAAVDAIEGFDGPRPRVLATRGDGERIELDCELVAACDGFHGAGRAALAGDGLRVAERAYPYAWLGILAQAPPSCEELIYAHHDRGFAMHSMRSPEVSRLYLQVDPGDDVAEWSDDRIWEELSTRLALDDWSLASGPIVEKTITPMRSFVAAPMRSGRLLLAGDAAHIVPPTGAKGLNLAAWDVRVLGEAIEASLLRGDEALLDAYSETCLRRVWRAADFSYWMTTMLHRQPDDEGDFMAGLQRSRLRYVCRSEAAARSLAENYVGMESV